MTRLLTDFLRHLGWCQHTEYSFPRTDPATGVMSTVCLGCTTRFEYDWEHMRRGKPVPDPVTPRPTLHKETQT